MTFHAMTEHYEEITVCGRPALFTGIRIRRDTVPDGLYAYDVRHDDECRGIPCEIAPFVMVNHWGTIILAEPLDLPDTLIASILYMITSGCTASTQYAYAEMLRLSTEGKINFVEDTREYARRAERMKKIFTDNGFHIVYDYDATQVVGDGFFFTIGYGNMTGGELLRELLYYGVSSISLSTTGSEQEGVRACTSRMRDELYPVMEERMRAFHEDH